VHGIAHLPFWYDGEAAGEWGCAECSRDNDLEKKNKSDKKKMGWSCFFGSENNNVNGDEFESRALGFHGLIGSRAVWPNSGNLHVMSVFYKWGGPLVLVIFCYYIFHVFMLDLIGHVPFLFNN
ncbi:hypothetical protein ACJX0J_038761, partial [Zea mays]